MRLLLEDLKRIIRNILIEELLGEPDQSEEEEREKEKEIKKKKANSRWEPEIDEDMDEMSTVGGGSIAGWVGPLGYGNGPGDKPYGNRKKLKSKNAM